MTANAGAQQQSVARNSVYMLLAEAATAMASIFVAGYVARVLGAEEYGRFLFAWAFVEGFAMFSNMGLHDVQVREIARDRANAPSFFGISLSLRVAAGISIYAIIVAVTALMNLPPVTKAAVYIAGIALAFRYIQDSCKAAFKAFETLHYAAILGLGTSVMSLLGRMFVVFLGWRLLGISWSILALDGVAALLCYCTLRRGLFKPVFNFRLSEIKRVFFLSLPFYFSNLFNVFYRKFDIIALQLLREDDSLVSWYGTANLLVSRLGFIATSILGATFPAISRLVHDGNRDHAERTYRGALQLLLLISLPIALGGMLTAQSIITMIYGERYAEAVLVFQILVWTLPLSFAGRVIECTLNAFGKEKVVTWISGTYVLGFALATIVLIPPLGHLGPAIAIVISELLHLLLPLLYAKFVLHLRSFDWTTLRTLLSGIFMAAIVYPCRQWNVAVVIVIGAATYCLGLVLFRVVSSVTLQQLKDMIVENKSL